MSSPDNPERPDAQATRLRRLMWVGVTAVALWFIADGLRGLWSGAGAGAHVFIVVAAVLVIAVVVLGVAYVLRRDRTD